MDDTWTYRPPTEPWLTILYFDADLVAIDKPSGLLSVPGRAPERQDSALTRLQARFPEVRVSHRLDMDTSGVMVFALHREAERALDRQFQARRVTKAYRARVSGHPPQDRGIIDLPLARARGQIRSLVSYERGKVARTAYTVLERRPDGSAELALRPQTGRSHQLRVHLLRLGHPILGDRFYAPPADVARAAQLLLHAEQLTVFQPQTGAPIALRAPLPEAWR